MPPTSWRQSRLTPLYKNKGDKGDPSNYRGLAVGHPIAKLVMAVLNERLSVIASVARLRAPTQAGFRKGHAVEDLVLLV